MTFAPPPGAPTFLLVHGGWHGSWCWAPLREELGAAGARSTTVDLPSIVGGPGARHDADGSERTSGLHDDAAVVAAAARDAVSGADGPVVVVAHSYGTLPTTEGLDGVEGLSRLVVIGGALLDAGLSLMDGLGGSPLPWWQPSPDGSSYAATDAVAQFYGLCTPEVAAASAARLLPQSATAFTERLEAAAWGSLPITYVITERDGCVSQEGLEMMAQRAQDVRRLPADHSPQLSMPAPLGRLLLEVAAG